MNPALFFFLVQGCVFITEDELLFRLKVKDEVQAADTDSDADTDTDSDTDDTDTDDTDTDDTDTDDTDCTNTYFTDSDSDGFGDPEESVEACSAPSGTVSNDEDCDDGNGAVYPGASEVCNDGTDNDCDTDTFGNCAITGEFDASEGNAVFYSTGSGDNIGIAVAGAGDINGDGYDDLLISATGDDGAANNAGATYLVLGPTSGELFLDEDADGVFTGETKADFAGTAVSGVDDLDGDGYADFVIAAPNNESDGTETGRAYFFEGPVSGTTSLADADVIIHGGSDDSSLGSAVALLGDVDNDGAPDVGIGASRYSGSSSNAGAAYILYGPVNSSDSASAASGATILGTETNIRFGSAIASAGDLDGDGDNEVIIGAINQDDGGEDAGKVYLYEGPVTGNIIDEDADATLIGDTEDANAGASLAGIADIDGDGLDDFIVGAPGATNGSVTGAGTAYIITGALSGSSSLSDATASISGTETDSAAGDSVSGLGDIDGDGVADILVGAPGSSGGYAVLQYGPVSGAMDLEDASLIISGDNASDETGDATASAGDINGDGVTDFIIGGRSAENTDGDASGGAYLFFGGGQ